MGCSGRVKADDIRPEQKWEFISLNDFKSTSCFQSLAYGYLWVSLIISIAVYCVDTFTAVNLIVFNKWSGEIQPKIPLSVSKWIFSICIILSWVNLGYEHLRAVRVIKRGAVAESFLDSLAVRLQSIRLGEGRGWRRFLVFAELTKSKKGAEYVALFTYFSFQSWIRIIFCQGPRQVTNAVTLYSVFQAKFTGLNTDDVGSTLLSFFKKIAFIAEENHQQAVILSGMVFTLVIWIFGALSLLLAVLFFVLFLWHYIPNADGGLSGYCERKVNQRLSKIVSVKVNKAIAEEERKRLKADAKAAKKGEKPIGRQATLPTLFDQKTEDSLPAMPMLNRNDTMATLPQYSSRPGTPASQPEMPTFEMDKLDQKRPFGNRTVTGSSTASATSFNSNAPLMGNASDMGYGRSGSPAPSLPPLDTNGYPAPPQRTMTANSNASNWNRGPQGPPRMPSAMGDRGYTASPVSYENQSPASYTQSPLDQYGRPMPRAVAELSGQDFAGRSYTPAGPAPSMGRRTPFDQNQGRSSPAPTSFAELDGYGRQSPAPAAYGPPGSEYGRSSPAPMGGQYGNEYGRSSPAPMGGDYRTPSSAPMRGQNMSRGSIDNFGRSSPAPGSVRGPTSPTGGYQSYNPNMRSASTAPVPQNNRPNPGPQYRNMTDPGPRGPSEGDYFSDANAPPLPRPGTAASQRGPPGPRMPTSGIARLASPAPYNGGGSQSPSFGGPGMGPGYRQ